MQVKPIFLLLFAIATAINSMAQAEYTLKGKVVDATSAEPLIGATIYESNSQKGTVSDHFGHFELQGLTDAEAAIEVSFIGYTPVRQLIQRTDDSESFITINLEEGVELEALEVIANSEDQKFGRNIGTVDFSVERLSKIPNPLGDNDLVKALTFAPGVSGGYEGSVGLYVRGGTPDQNLILLDDAKIYNGSHLLGFLSSFNGDAIKQVQLFKGDKPADFGGRLSSVLDIRVKEGNKKQDNIELTVSPITSKLLVELPLAENRTSLLIAGRASYLDLLTLPLYLQYKNGNRDDYTGYTMYDLNTKLHHQLSESTYLSFSYFRSKDRFVRRDVSEVADSLESLNRIRFGNEAANLKLVKYFNKISTNTSLVYSRYNTTISTRGNPDDSFLANGDARSSVQSIGIKSKWTWNIAANYQLHFGAEWENEQFEPTLIDLTRPTGEFLRTEDLWNEDKQSNSLAAYFNNRIKVLDRLEFNLGIRFWQYQIGQYDQFFVEPRLAMAVDMAAYGSIRLAYNQTNQGVHLLSNNGLTLPTDFWLPATENLPASGGEEWSVGWKKLFDKNLGIELGGFYKTNDDVIALKDGVNYYEAGLEVEDKIETGGQGRAYGLEIAIDKKTEKFTGLLAYTWSKSERQFDAINGGAWFPLRYDRRHDLSATTTYKLSDKWTLAANAIYSTGFAITLPSTVYILEPNRLNPVSHFESRNNARNQDYFRVDISAVRQFKKSSLTLGVYNVLGRSNPLYQNLFFDLTGDIFESGQQTYITRSESSALPAFIPSISYHLKIR